MPLRSFLPRESLTFPVKLQAIMPDLEVCADLIFFGGDWPSVCESAATG